MHTYIHTYIHILYIYIYMCVCVYVRARAYVCAREFVYIVYITERTDQKDQCIEHRGTGDTLWSDRAPKIANKYVRTHIHIKMVLYANNLIKCLF
jgi:hypothetical protein